MESIGLHGEGYAVGWVYVVDGVEVRAGREACDPWVAYGTKDDRDWVAANVPAIPMTQNSTRDVRAAFRAAFRSAWFDAKADGAIMVADCAWPVEANFLTACAADIPEARRWGRPYPLHDVPEAHLQVHRWRGPYPLHDVATARLCAGLDPLATVMRLPNEEPKHDPLADARQSARLFAEAMSLTVPR